MLIKYFIYCVFSQQSTIADTKEVVGRTTASLSNNSNQQTASIIVVTAAMTPTSMTPSMNVAGTTRSTSIFSDEQHRVDSF